jgi:UDPglucose 6-dehydrogenase
MKIAVIGTGYVGLVTGACFAETGNQVICADIDEQKITMLRQGKIPIYEPGLPEMTTRNMQKGRLSFTTDLEHAVKDSDILFIAVGTPPGEDGSADLVHVMTVARTIGQFMNGYKIIVDKSTVPVGTAKMVSAEIASFAKHEFDVVSNPEFLKEGDAVNDFLKPDRIVVGVDTPKAEKIMRELYAPFLRTGHPVIIMDVASAELTKYAANGFLATKITFMNEIANLCEQVGADVEKVRLGIGSDKRIGSQFLFAGVGYGGSCFPKDVKALIQTGRQYDCPVKILETVDQINREQRRRFFEKIVRHFEGNLKGKTFAVWGLSFKPRTDDMREAPAIDIIEWLLEKGASVRAYDPQAMDIARQIFQDRIMLCLTDYDTLPGADALILVTEWNEFREPDFDKIKSLLKQPLIFDGRNLYDMEVTKERGFQYYSIGRGGKKNRTPNK